MMLLDIEKVDQYGGDTSITNEVQNMNKIICLQLFGQNQ
jgi:hypothetical protein